MRGLPGTPGATSQNGQNPPPRVKKLHYIVAFRHNVETDDITGIEYWGVLFEFEELDAYNMDAALLCFRLEHPDIYRQFLDNARRRLHPRRNERLLGPLLFADYAPSMLANTSLYKLAQKFPHYDFTPFLPD